MRRQRGTGVASVGHNRISDGRFPKEIGEEIFLQIHTQIHRNHIGRTHDAMSITILKEVWQVRKEKRRFKGVCRPKGAGGGKKENPLKQRRYGNPNHTVYCRAQPGAPTFARTLICADVDTSHTYLCMYNVHTYVSMRGIHTCVD